MITMRIRCFGVALVLTAAGAGAAVGLGEALLPLSGDRTVEDAVVQLCVALLLGCTLWGWAAGLAAVAEAWRGAPSGRPGGVVRRLVLAACGVAVSAALVAPTASAAPSDGDPLTGLPLPERATDGPRTPDPERLVVRTGDTLWALAAARLPPEATPATVDAAWRDLYADNRAVLGPDPDLVRPGQVLAMPHHLPQERR